MKFIKKYRIQIVIVVAVLVLALLIYGFCNLFLSTTGKSVYGTRLDGIEEVLPTDDEISKVKEEIGALEAVNTIEYQLQGRIMNFIIDVKDGTDLITAHGLADKLLPYFTDAQKSYFDIQVFVTSKEETKEEDETSLYPMIGYKHKTSVGFSWNVSE